MIKLISKFTILITMLFTLTACIDKVESDYAPASPTIGSASDTSQSTPLVLGKSYYDTSCAGCHGADGTGTSYPINKNACEDTDCSNLDTLASYINSTMPKGNAQACSLDGERSCAYSTAAYIINGFATDEPAESTVPAESPAPVTPSVPAEPTVPATPSVPAEPTVPTTPSVPTEPTVPTTPEPVPTTPDPVPTAPDPVPTTPDPVPTAPDPVPTTPEEPSDDSVNLVAGKSSYDTSCSGCHGSDGGGIFPINEDACQKTDCSSIDALSSYIAATMPRGNVESCSLDGEDSCALTTAAYIMNKFSTDTTVEPNVPVEPDETVEPIELVEPVELVESVELVETEVPSVQSPLARLTNDEFMNSVRTLLNLSAESPQVVAAKNSLASESRVKGLTNDSSTQTLTQLAIAGYSTMAIAASDDFLMNVTSREELAALLNCSAIVESFNVNNQLGTCLVNYSNILISQAYRRPANDTDAENIAALLDTNIAISQEYNQSSIDLFKNATQSMLQYILLSPEFLLIVENGEDNSGNSDASTKQLSDHEIATRLALFLAGTLPDDALIADADAGLLVDKDVRLQHANRLLNSDTGITQFTTLVTNWLDIDESITSATDLASLNTFITNWLVNGRPFSDLYQAPVTVEHVDGTETLEPLGVLGLKAFVASHTSFPTPSFITRGVFVVERLLCEALPDGIPDDALNAGALTAVEVFEHHAQQACASCHRVFDNYGAAFQQFDAETSLFNPLNQDFGSSFDLYDIGDVSASITGLGDLGYTMANSSKAPTCMAELWYRHSKRRNIDAEGKDDQALQTLVDDWVESGDRSMKALLRSIVTSESFITLYL